MWYYMSEYFQKFNHLIKIYIQWTIQNSQTFERFCCLLYAHFKCTAVSSQHHPSILIVPIHLRVTMGGMFPYSDSKNPFHTNPKCSVGSAPPYSMGIPLSLGGVIYSTYPWLQDWSLGHVI